MGKSKHEIAKDFEERMEDAEHSRRSGWMVTLLVLGLIGAVIWFVMSKD